MASNYCADCAGFDIEWMYKCHKHGLEYCRGCSCPECADELYDDDDSDPLPFTGPGGANAEQTDELRGVITSAFRKLATHYDKIADLEPNELAELEEALAMLQAHAEDANTCSCGYGCPPFNGCRHL